MCCAGHLEGFTGDDEGRAAPNARTISEELFFTRDEVRCIELYEVQRLTLPALAPLPVTDFFESVYFHVHTYLYMS